MKKLKKSKDFLQIWYLYGLNYLHINDGKMTKEKVREVKRLVEQTPDLKERIYKCLTGECTEELIGESIRKVYGLGIEKGIKAEIGYLALKVYPESFQGQEEEIIKELAMLNHFEKKKLPTPEFSAMVKAEDRYGILTQDLTEGGKYGVREFNFSDSDKELKNYSELQDKWREYFKLLMEEELDEKISSALFVQSKSNYGHLIIGDIDRLKKYPKKIIEEFYGDYPNKGYLISCESEN